MLWVRVYALLNFLSQISFYWSQGTAFSSMGWFKPRSIVPFQCVAKHDLGFLGWGSRGGGGRDLCMCLEMIKTELMFQSRHSVSSACLNIRGTWVFLVTCHVWPSCRECSTIFNSNFELFPPLKMDGVGLWSSQAPRLPCTWHVGAKPGGPVSQSASTGR